MPPLGFLIIALIGVVVLLAMSAFFSSSESAIFSLGPGWIEETAETGGPSGRVLQALREDPHRLLVTILVGNNLVNIAFTSIVTILVTAWVPPGLAVVVTTLGVTTVILIFGEIVPKSYGLGNAQRWSLRVARPLSIVERALGPLVRVFDILTRRLTVVLGGEPDIEETYLD
jgi:Mg2+/Co2+ transporter CorB